MDAVREAYTLSGGPSELANTLSQIEFGLGRPDASLQILAAAIARFPQDPLLRLSRAKVLLELERLREARGEVEEALHLSPEDPRALYVRGSIHVESNDLAPAEADFRRALAIEPSLADAARDLAVLLMETGREKEAVEILESHSGGGS